MSTYTPTTSLSIKLGSISKAIVAQISAILVLVGGVGAFAGFLPGPVGVTLAAVATALTGISTYLKANTDTATKLIDDSTNLGRDIADKF